MNSCCACATRCAVESHCPGGERPCIPIPPTKRPSLSIRLARLRAWEYWPTWAIYTPLWPWILLLAARHRSLAVCTLANTSPALHRMFGESKWEILKLLPQDAIVGSAFVPPGPLEQRRELVVHERASRNWPWPIILKPDVGERGEGVDVIRDEAHLDRYLRAHLEPLVVQEFHPGPEEAGVFYMHIPAASDRAGESFIFSITDKDFAHVVGDGVSTISDLIHAHTRYRLQAAAYLSVLKNAAARVPAPGERVKIGEFGNHARGCKFIDGSSLITPELTRAIDDIARRTEGFYFGRFDIRYVSRDELRQGRGFKIIELNGLLSESTNIYDPAFSFFTGQRILRRQWRMAFRIGAAVREAGLATPAVSPRQALREYFRFRAGKSSKHYVL
jgi:hypothetical protein